jgi:hypothetical protein
VTVNKELLRRTMAFIEANPSKHNQLAWCGTAQCFAGWACSFEGWRPLDLHERSAFYADDDDEDGFDPSSAVKQGGTIALVEDVAQSLLGLDVYQAALLFDGDNTVDDLRDHVKALCNV